MDRTARSLRRPYLSSGAYAMIALGQAEPVPVLVFIAQALRALHIVVGAVHRRVVANVLEDVELQLHEHMGFLADAGGTEVFLRLSRDYAGVLLKGFAVRAPHVAEGVEDAKIAPLLQEGGGEVRHGRHIAGVHLGEGEIRGIEADAVPEDLVRNIGAGEGDGAQGALKVHNQQGQVVEGIHLSGIRGDIHGTLLAFATGAPW